MSDTNHIWSTKETARIDREFKDLFADLANDRVHDNEYDLAEEFKGTILDIVLGDNDEDSVAYEILESYLLNVDWVGIASVYYVPIDSDDQE